MAWLGVFGRVGEGFGSQGLHNWALVHDSSNNSSSCSSCLEAVHAAPLSVCKLGQSGGRGEAGEDLSMEMGVAEVVEGGGGRGDRLVQGGLAKGSSRRGKRGLVPQVDQVDQVSGAQLPQEQLQQQQQRPQPQQQQQQPQLQQPQQQLPQEQGDQQLGHGQQAGEDWQGLFGLQVPLQSHCNMPSPLMRAMEAATAQKVAAAAAAAAATAASTAPPAHAQEGGGLGTSGGSSRSGSATASLLAALSGASNAHSVPERALHTSVSGLVLEGDTAVGEEGRGEGEEERQAVGKVHTAPSAHTPEGVGLHQGSDAAGFTANDCGPLVTDTPASPGVLPTLSQVAEEACVVHTLCAASPAAAAASIGNGTGTAAAPPGALNPPVTLSLRAVWQQHVGGLVCGLLTPGMPCPWASLQQRAVVEAAAASCYGPLRVCLALLELAAHTHALSSQWSTEDGQRGGEARCAHTAADPVAIGRGVGGGEGGSQERHPSVVLSLLLNMVGSSVGRVSVPAQQQALQLAARKGSQFGR